MMFVMMSDGDMMMIVMVLSVMHSSPLSYCGSASCKVTLIWVPYVMHRVLLGISEYLPKTFSGTLYECPFHCFDCIHAGRSWTLVSGVLPYFPQHTVSVAVHF